MSAIAAVDADVDVDVEVDVVLLVDLDGGPARVMLQIAWPQGRAPMHVVVDPDGADRLATELRWQTTRARAGDAPASC